MIINDIGERIRELRKHAGLTQEKLALDANIGVSFLGDVERGLKKPSIETLEKLLSALGMTLIDFFNFDLKYNPIKESSALDKINALLKRLPENEIETVYNIVVEILKFKP